MAYQYYLPRGDSERKTWLNNLNEKADGYAGDFDLTPDEISQLDKDSKFMAYVIDAAESWKKYSMSVLAYRDALMDGSTADIGDFPTPPPLGTVPVKVKAGVFQRVATLVQKIKKKRGVYNESVGKNLGIVGADKVIDFDTAQPVVKAQLKDEHPYYTWARNEAEMFEVAMDYGDGKGQHIVGRFTKARYWESHLPEVDKSAIYTIMVRFIVDDKPVGSWSNPVSMVVAGIN